MLSLVMAIKSYRIPVDINEHIKKFPSAKEELKKKNIKEKMTPQLSKSIKFTVTSAACGILSEPV